MRQFLSSLYAWLRTSRYTAYLESEVSRLQKENRDLMNALLSASHLPMLPREDASVAPPRMKKRVLPSQWKAEMERRTGEKHEEN